MCNFVGCRWIFFFYIDSSILSVKLSVFFHTEASNWLLLHFLFTWEIKLVRKQWSYESWFDCREFINTGESRFMISSNGALNFLFVFAENVETSLIVFCEEFEMFSLPVFRQGERVAILKRDDWVQGRSTCRKLDVGSEVIFIWN